jgi:hypothetical protein
MNTQVIRTSIIALLAAMASCAQTSMPMFASIPFSFVAGGITFAAGEYTVDQSIAGAIIVKSADRKASAIMQTATVQSIDVRPTSTLVFHRYGNTYILSEVWTAGDYSGRQTKDTSRERGLEAKHRTPEKIVVLARR